MRVLTPAVKKPTGFRRRGSVGVEDGDAVAEHVADVDVAAVDHHLHAVGPAALIAVRQVTDAPADARRRDHLPRGLAWARPGPGLRLQRGQPQSQQPFQLFAASEFPHMHIRSAGDSTPETPLHGSAQMCLVIGEIRLRRGSLIRPTTEQRNVVPAGIDDTDKENAVMKQLRFVLALVAAGSIVAIDMKPVFAQTTGTEQRAAGRRAGETSPTRASRTPGSSRETRSTRPPGSAGTARPPGSAGAAGAPGAARATGTPGSSRATRTSGETRAPGALDGG